MNAFFNIDLWIGLIGAVVGAVLGYCLTRLHERCQTKKRNEQYVKEIQLLTDAVLKYTVDCNKAIGTYCENLQKKPYDIFHLNKGIIASIERLSRLDATLVYEAFEYKGKADKFYRFLNLTDQLLTFYGGVYANYETNNKNVTLYIKEFEEIEIDLIQYFRNPLLAEDLKLPYIKYLKAQRENHSPKDIQFVNKELMEPIYKECEQGLLKDQNLQNKSERAIGLYQSVCKLQTIFAQILRSHLNDIQLTIKMIEEIKL